MIVKILRKFKALKNMISPRHSENSEAFGYTGKNVGFCTAGLLAGIIEWSFGIKSAGKRDHMPVKRR